MIISKTPFRISFCGGGTDLKEFYSHGHGAVVSTAINKYMYITVNKKFDNEIRISYSKTENVKNVKDVKHGLVREAMKMTGVTQGVEITSMADIHSKGTGLGSSSSFLVGLLNALYAYKGEHKSAEFLARKACEIEIDILKEPIGKQDQYIAAYGGFNYMKFNPDESVFVEPIICKKEIKECLEQNLLLFYTGIKKKANEVLNEQKENSKNKIEVLSTMSELAGELAKALNQGSLDEFGKLLHKNWMYKKELASGITNKSIEKYYEKAMKAGASGGKLLGAGGRGFLLVYCEKEKQKNVIDTLKELRTAEFKLEGQGSRIIYVGD